MICSDCLVIIQTFLINENLKEGAVPSIPTSDLTMAVRPILNSINIPNAAQRLQIAKGDLDTFFFFLQNTKLPALIFKV